MTSRESSPRLPPDDQLPAAETLLDVHAMADHLGELFGAVVSNVRIRYVDYVPAAALTVQYNALLGEAGAPIVEAFATTDGHSWALHSEDAALPLLSASQRQLTDALGLPSSGLPIIRLAWIPQRRAVLRCGDVVVKLYRNQVEASRAEWALKALGDKLPTARFIGSHREHRAVVQQALRGQPLERSDAATCAAGAAAVLRELHSLNLTGLPDLGPAHLLASVDGPAALAGFALPQLRERISALVETLAATMPEASETVPVHGDFNVGQLLMHGRQICVVDTDTLAEGSPSVDLAAFAANLHNGRQDDGRNVRTVLAELTRAYGQTPHDLSWHLAVTMMRRVDRPIRRLKKRWPERTAAIVTAIEALVHEN